jgi:hypothetical protein
MKRAWTWCGILLAAGLLLTGGCKPPASDQ